MTQPVIRPFLMFEGHAEEAMNFYISLFPGSAVMEVTRYGEGGPGAAGSVMKAVFSLNGQTVICTDSPVKHGFTFTPSFSFFVDCAGEDDLRRWATALGEEGKVLMGIANYGFSRLFTWVSDRYGVSWQLNLP